MTRSHNTHTFQRMILSRPPLNSMIQLLDTLPVCQDFNRSMCNRPTCRFVHLTDGKHCGILGLNRFLSELFCIFLVFPSGQWQLAEKIFFMFRLGWLRWVIFDLEFYESCKIYVEKWIYDKKILFSSWKWCLKFIISCEFTWLKSHRIEKYQSEREKFQFR